MNNETQELLGVCEFDLSSYGDNEFATKQLDTGAEGVLEIGLRGVLAAPKSPMELPALRKQQTSISSGSSTIDSQQQEAMLSLHDKIKEEKKRRANLESDHRLRTEAQKDKIHQLTSNIKLLEQKADAIRAELSSASNAEDKVVALQEAKAKKEKEIDELAEKARQRK